MYAVKGSWVGQTFALATANDSAGRKSRVRRSKEERKFMVETFIKRYQTSNNGSFPSLNLTHKEVGGSFYTVREIVREIIQENRVLGPARFSPEVQHDNNVAGQYLLGSTATEPQFPFINSENEQNNVSNCQVNKTTELSLDTKEYYINHRDVESFQGTREDKTNKIREDLDDQACSNSESKDAALSKHEDCGSSEVSLNTNEQCLDESKKIIGSFMDGNQINGLFHETDNLQAARPPVSGSLEIDEEFVLSGGGKGQVNLLAEEVVVETFPLRPENNGIDGVRRLLTDSGDLNGISNDQEVKPVDLTNVRPYLDKISSSVNSLDHSTSKGNTGSQWSAPGRSPNNEYNHIHVNGEVVQHSEHNLINKSSDPTKSPVLNEDTLVLRDCMDQISSPSAVTSKTSEQYDHQSNNAPKGTICLDDKSSKGNDKEPSYFAANANNNRRDDKAVATSSPVDRINLESWERTALKQQPKPLLAILKAFADAWVKFWS